MIDQGAGARGATVNREVGSEAEWGWEQELGGKQAKRSQELGTRVFGVAMGSLGP